MSKIVTFGEIMLRLAPKGYLRFLQEPEFQATFGGGEANVAVSLANYGLDAAFVTKLPENPIGEAAIRELRKYGVDVGGISTGGSRIGIYYLEKGASQRPSTVKAAVMILIGTRFLRTPAGSILQGLPPHLGQMWLKFVKMR